MAGQELKDQERDAVLVGRKLTTVAVPAAIGLLCYALWQREQFFTVVGMGILVSLASLVAGGLVGFLFGIPKSAEDKESKDPQSKDGGATTSKESSSLPILRRNTNIEEISDWLTKIIVGLGIYELKNVPELFRRLSAFLSPAFGGGQGSGPLAVILVVTFSCSGFILGYLLTVLFITKAIERVSSTRRRADENLQDDAKAAELIHAAIGPAVEGEVSDALRQQVVGLAARYERERAGRPPGPERTAVMEDVTREMRKLALAAYAMLDALTKSESPGQRLAGCAFLQIRPNGKYIEWLSERIASEVPFIKYQAALALRNAVRVLQQTDRDRLRKAVQDAEKALGAANRTKSDEYAVVKDAERELA